MKIQPLKIKVRTLQEYHDLQDWWTSSTNHIIQLNHVSKIRILKKFYLTKRFDRKHLLSTSRMVDSW
jgi:hypothetical protein